MTEKKNDGGSAFPTAYHDCASSFDLGMSLRDWFAGQALAGLMAQSHAGPKDWTEMGHGWGEDTANSLNKNETYIAATMAGFAYLLADALLKAREA